jgi:uncharacterized protein
MRFKINEIGVEGVALDIPLTAEWLREACPELDARPAAPGLGVAGRIAKSGDDYLLRADITGQLETPCARCLEPARVALKTPLVVTYVPFEETGNDDETEGDDPDVVVFSGGEIDLADAIRDELVLAMPMNPLCTESCRGLCPVCGGNRNQVACTCEIERAAPASRMAALSKVKL